MGEFTKIKISVCIPVFGTEHLLSECLQSVAEQDFNSVEIIVVNDASRGMDSEDKTCNKIVKAFKKHSPFKVTYIEHSENLGLLEARRSAVYTAKGKYIACLDSDDKFLPGALKALYDSAESICADIVQWFFIAKNAKKYVGIEDLVYFYNAETGMTTRHLISDKSQLKGIVSATSAFTAIHQWLQAEADRTGKLAISEAEWVAIRRLSHNYLKNNLLQVRECVVPELKTTAHEMLCEYWGKDFVERMEAKINNRM
ncbi:MAG: glycosyltransferase family 2 protein [Treponema sp.]|nr:glycosyltransferase family 2 protein [Treponema sp.]